MEQKDPPSREAGASSPVPPRTGHDSPRRLLIAAAVVGALLCAALLRYAIDILIVVVVVRALGWSAEQVSDWLDGDPVPRWAPAPMAVTFLAVVLLFEWVSGPRLFLPILERHTPQIVTRALDTAAEHGWGRVVLVPNLPFARAEVVVRNAAAGQPADVPSSSADARLPAIDGEAPDHPAPPPRRDAPDRAMAGVDAEAAERGASHTSVRTVVTLSSSNPVVPGTMLRLTAVVTARSGEVPEGTVVFRQDGAVLGAVDLDADGRATLDVRHLSTGDHRITAEYSGLGRFEPSQSPRLELTVGR